ncbi:ABC transporter ATP-binding protein [Hymenobacter qilianensis]|uniref:ABC transporter ATP-binding protein n=2 Tax=Hymenobacter qilianensis TaxID=1385715 RepID=A0ACB5PNK8_9BACT|nr:ABC transporter ATP-binding protein [Hymenobacter qilianensis]QNP53441.1 ABC transporter ATP-binding protein [Hymenobacter qilianensis]GGF56502.1 ABC transporter ATP-binding protein [Hymenobacter qilianensis]
MSELVIQIEKLSKVYRLGTIGTGYLLQDLQRWWTTAVRKQQDPFFQLPDAQFPNATQSQALWALQNVDFEVKQGEVWGIIGSNGAGKSTLLKIVSRIIRPSAGFVRGRGKVSSLLEVGTGFHSELSGRENIYLSGYILGMSKAEIRAKFDEIVAFSGVEKFLDTPVKRYSSGMYVRLAFAVAAHLEPDILIIDEVLAVGDAEFQKKCLGKMREVATNDGRTILFVSHSMQAINNLCDKGLWLQHGKVRATGPVNDVVNRYLIDNQQLKTKQSWTDPNEAPGNDKIRFKLVELIPQLLQPDAPLDIRTPLTIRFQFWNFTDDILISTHLTLFSYNGDCVFDVASTATICQKGVVSGECTIPGNFLNDGSYYINLYVLKDTTINLYDYEQCLSFDLEDYRTNIQWYGKWWGVVRPTFPFFLTQTHMALP